MNTRFVLLRVGLIPLSRGWPQCCRGWGKVRDGAMIVLVSVVTALGPTPTRAQSTPRPASADDVLDDVKDFIGDAFDVGIWILVGGGYLVAAYMIIVGAYKFFTDRDGGLAQFLLGVAVALGMVVLMTYFVTTGQTQLGNL